MATEWNLVFWVRGWLVNAFNDERWGAGFYTAARRLRSHGCLRSYQELFGEMLCEHLRCRLESRRARWGGSADLQVGIIINVTSTFIPHLAPAG